MALNNYQYGTSPRKIEPEYRPRRTTKKKNKSTSTKEKMLREKRKEQQRQEQRRQKIKLEKKKHHKNIAIILGVFIVLLIVSYRNSLINEKFSEIQSKKSKLSSIEKANGQLEVNIEGSLNLGNIGNEAKETLGMEKLNNDQKVYVTLDKKDYVESSVNKEANESTNWFQKIIEKIFGK